MRNRPQKQFYPITDCNTDTNKLLGRLRKQSKRKYGFDQISDKLKYKDYIRLHENIDGKREFIR